ncbi:MAG TPA: C39 family peptidase, partial [Candidatus Binatia bacterium]|nr:C39 family peptidase [Candidatus Binatia bacterium]
TGYGVYWDPIAKVGLKYRRTQALRNANLQEVIGHLDQGRPVVVWGYFGGGNRYTWNTPQGYIINAVHGEHARTLVGYVGPSDNPEQVILLDPIYGELYWDTQRFLENWGALENGAVVVYHHSRWVKSANDNTVWELSADAKKKYALAMNWDSFISQGGVGEGIHTVDQTWIDSIENGGILESLPLQ